MTLTVPTYHDVVRALRDCNSYAATQLSIDVIETHFACVFLVGDLAYKLKKPIQVDRMDFRTLTARERSCIEEIRLNRRLAPQVYLGVSAVVREHDGTLRVREDFSARADVVEWLIRMRRLPAERMLDVAVRTGAISVQNVVPLATRLATFYRDETSLPMSAAEYVQRLHAKVDEAHRELLAVDLNLDTSLVNDCLRRHRALLARQATELGHRASSGKFIEGHGDLRPEHLFLGGASAGLVLLPCVIDSLEFDRDLRLFDPFEELSFLALECERLKADWVAREIIAIYRAVAHDDIDGLTFNFYRAQRALTRAKIAAWHQRDPEVRGRADWRAQAHGYLQMTEKPWFFKT